MVGLYFHFSPPSSMPPFLQLPGMSAASRSRARSAYTRNARDYKEKSPPKSAAE
jgi:hypothetical protein